MLHIHRMPPQTLASGDGSGDVWKGGRSYHGPLSKMDLAGSNSIATSSSPGKCAVTCGTSTCPSLALQQGQGCDNEWPMGSAVGPMWIFKSTNEIASSSKAEGKLNTMWDVQPCALPSSQRRKKNHTQLGTREAVRVENRSKPSWTSYTNLKCVITSHWDMLLEMQVFPYMIS